MPRYRYNCAACGEDFLVMHSPDEAWEKCTVCGTAGEVNKLLTRPSYKLTPADQQRHKAGTTTEEFIASSKEELKQMKKELIDKR